MKDIFDHGIMRVVLTAFIFLFAAHEATAPAPDFHLKCVKFRKASAEAVRIYHRLEFQRFINDLGYRESLNNWRSVNCIGCFGEWQFAESTIRYLGFRGITLRKFRADPDIFPRQLQVGALESLIRVNLALLKDYEHFIGDTVGGVEVTKSGLIAAAHLGGAGTVKLFLKSGGRINKKDVLKTSVRDYMKRFSGYDLG